jgi:hypothetical protein
MEREDETFSRLTKNIKEVLLIVATKFSMIISRNMPDKITLKVLLKLLWQFPHQED